jgi:hypothetical protein
MTSSASLVSYRLFRETSFLNLNFYIEGGHNKVPTKLHGVITGMTIILVFSFYQNVAQLFENDLLKLALSNMICTINPASNILRRDRDILPFSDKFPLNTGKVLIVGLIKVLFAGIYVSYVHCTVYDNSHC